jgi:hypothetical protein
VLFVIYESTLKYVSRIIVQWRSWWHYLGIVVESRQQYKLVRVFAAILRMAICKKKTDYNRIRLTG